MCYHYMDRIRPVNHAIMIVIVLITFVIVGCKDERSKVAVGDTDASSQNPCAPPLIQAILDDDKQAVQKLITNEGNLNEALPWVMSPLATAATWGRTEIATILLQHRANPSQRDPKFANFTPLHHASRRGHVEIVQLLIEHGADVNASTSDGMTPLMSGTYSEKPEIALILLRAGAKASSKNTQGKTAIDIAEENDQKIYAECIKAYKATDH